MEHKPRSVYSQGVQQTEQLARHVESLPQGLDSYPDAQSKASVVRTFLERLPAREDWWEPLPPALRELAAAPPPSSVWLPEVHCQALYMGARDLVFASDGAYVDFWRATNEAIVTGPLYRALFAVASPARVLRGATSRWNRLHLGTSLELEAGEGEARLTMRFPAGLISELGTRSFATAFATVLRASGGHGVAVELTDYDLGSARYEAHWH